jgi:chromosome segregation ATPase
VARKNIIEFIVKLISKDATKDLKKFESDFKKWAVTITRVAVQATGAIIALGSTILFLYKNLTKSYAEFSRFSKTLGVSVETLSKLEYAARQTGVGMTTLKNAVENMSPAINSAVDGVGIAAEALEELGLDAEKLNKMNVVDQFLALADAFQELDDKTRTLILSQDIFGDGASEIARLLMGGREEILKFAEAAEDLGIVVQTRAAKEAEKFRQQLTELEKQMGRIHQFIITTFGPAFRWLAEKWTAFVKTMADGMTALDNMFGLGATNETQLEFKLKALEIEQARIFDQIKKGKWQIKDISHILEDYSKRIDMARQALEFFRKESADVAETLGGGGDAKGKEWLASEVDTVFPFLTHIPTARQKKDNRPDSIKAIDEELELVKERYRKIQEEYQRHVSFMQSLSDQAARSIQSAFADFFFDPFEDGLKGMVKSFIDAIRRMIAEWLAFQTITMLGIPGFFNTAVGVPGRAAGGSVTAGNPYIVGERGPELFVPGASGTIIPNKSSRC